MSEHPATPWHAAYNAYWEHLGWPPLASGRPCPHFFDLPLPEWQAWTHAYRAALAWTTMVPSGPATGEGGTS